MVESKFGINSDVQRPADSTPAPSFGQGAQKPAQVHQRTKRKEWVDYPCMIRLVSSEPLEQEHPEQSKFGRYSEVYSVQTLFTDTNEIVPQKWRVSSKDQFRLLNDIASSGADMTTLWLMWLKDKPSSNWTRYRVAVAGTSPEQAAFFKECLDATLGCFHE